jgi:hypothetical protein
MEPSGDNGELYMGRETGCHPANSQELWPRGYTKTLESTMSKTPWMHSWFQDSLLFPASTQFTAKGQAEVSWALAQEARAVLFLQQTMRGLMWI